MIALKLLHCILYKIDQLCISIINRAVLYLRAIEAIELYREYVQFAGFAIE